MEDPFAARGDGRHEELHEIRRDGCPQCHKDFHCKHLSDEQMAELNPIIRNAIYTTIYAFESWKDSRMAEVLLDFHCMSIPKSWDEPELLPGFGGGQ